MIIKSIPSRLKNVKGIITFHLVSSSVMSHGLAGPGGAPAGHEPDGRRFGALRASGLLVRKRASCLRKCGGADDSFVICLAAYCGRFRQGTSIGAVVCYPLLPT
jgi:hypothetical protein